MEIHGSQGVKYVYFFRKHDFLGCRETKSEFDLGSVKFGISEVDFLPFRVQKKGVIEKGLTFDDLGGACFCLRVKTRPTPILPKAPPREEGRGGTLL